MCEHSVSTTSKGCPYSRKVSPRRLTVILAIGVFRIRDSDLEFATSSAHTADDCPSSYIGPPIPEIPSDTPLTAEMTLEDRLWAMEEELMKHQMKSDAIEISLQAILDKLNILPRKEDVMQSELDFRKPESEDDLRDSWRKADEGTASTLAKVKPAMPADFNGNRKNEQLTALTKLEGTSWYQGKDLVDDYID